MRLLPLALLTSTTLASAWASEGISPADLANAITAGIRSGTLTWTPPLDRDRDGRCSHIEAMAACAGAVGWVRRNLPEQFRAMDSDGDRALSRAELARVASRETQAQFIVADRVADPVRPPNGAAGTSVGAGDAYVSFGNQQAYIADYDVVNGQYDPVIGVIGWGTVLAVGGVTITVRRP